ncbi:MAG: preprotein translocase subunit SecG [Bacteroidia bacterium]|nr:preprotein translocase subunit SecG [Bacteroidia bacterium]
MYTLILILAIIVCVALTFIVLIQNPKGGGIAASFSAGNQIMGVKRTNQVVEKVTWGLAIALLVLTLSSNLFVSSTATNSDQSDLQQQIEEGDLPDIQFQAPAQEDNGTQTFQPETTVPETPADAQQ